MNRFSVIDLPLNGLKLVERRRLGDSRGSLSRIFCADELAAAGWCKPIAQINHSSTARCGTVRGMHFQRPPYAEMKLVSCIRGKVWDVAVDLRRNSPTFLHWHAECLSVENGLALLIPEGFAHGFQSLTDDVELIYCHSAMYNHDAESCLNPRDPLLAIEWPNTISEISSRDEGQLMIESGFTGVLL